MFVNDATSTNAARVSLGFRANFEKMCSSFCVQIQRALGYETLQQLGAKVGISPDEMAAKLSEILPKAIDKLTPKGTEPAPLRQRPRSWF